MLDQSAKAALADTRFADVRWLPEVDSTNRVLVELAREGEREGVVVAADHQTAGRGRLGRRWEAPPKGSLLLSVLLRPPLSPEHAYLCSAAVAVAAAEACLEVAGFGPRIKWPNDLVVEHEGGWRKLAGLLAESELRPDGPLWLVVGIGLNVNWPDGTPDGLATTAIAANQVAGREVDRSALFVRLLQRLDEHYGTLCEPGGWRGVLFNLRRLCATLGQRVRVELAGETLEGKAVEIAADGVLLVECDDGRLRLISAGDVVHLRPA